MTSRYRLFLLVGLLLLPFAAHADDVNFVSYYSHSIEEKALLQAALEATKKQYGPYRLTMFALPMQRKRMLRELADGQAINISAQITTQEWEHTLIPIRIPIDKGLAGFRIALIDGRRQHEFSNISSLQQLRALPVGVGEQWATREIFEKAGLPVVTGNDHDRLYGMLMQRRFDYLPRSIAEAFLEQRDQVGQYPHLAVEQSLALYLPAPRYFFVSPKTPQLAERLRVGLEKLIASGEFDRIFLDSYSSLIAQANICGRTVFKLDNPELGPETPLQRKQLWFDPFNASDKRVTCPSRQGLSRKTEAH